MTDIMHMMTPGQRKPQDLCATGGDIWAAIDTVAAQRDMSLGQLALYANLDQSMFVTSRRHRNIPSLRTILTLLYHHDIRFIEFAEIVEAEAAKRRAYERRRGI